MNSRIIFLSAWVAGLGLFGCASDAPETPDMAEAVAPRPALPIVTVDATQVAQYWLIDDEPGRTEGKLSGRAVSYGCVAVDFGIDADGQVFDVRVSKSWPQGTFVEFVQQAMRAHEFEPAETNPARQPVRTQWILAAADVDGKKSLHIADQLLHYCR